jgi:hypothetical protein
VSATLRIFSSQWSSLIVDQADLNSSFAVFAPGIVHSASAYCQAEGGKHDSSVGSSCYHGGGIFSKCG